MHGLLENAIYGGRIDSLSDLRILRSYLQQYFSSRLLSGPHGRGRKGVAFPSHMSLPSSCNILVGGTISVINCTVLSVIVSLQV